MIFRLAIILILGFVAYLFASDSRKEGPLNHYKIMIKNHHFHPATIEIEANKKIVLIVQNEDDTVEEFESLDLKREKIVPANSQIQITIGPLSKGEYKFFGEFHEETAQGVIKVN